MRVHCRMPHASLYFRRYFVRLINQATSDDLLDPITALLSHPKWLVVIKEDLMLAARSNYSPEFASCHRSTHRGSTNIKPLFSMQR